MKEQSPFLWKQPSFHLHASTLQSGGGGRVLIRSGGRQAGYQEACAGRVIEENLKGAINKSADKVNKINKSQWNTEGASFSTPRNKQVKESEQLYKEL